MLSNYSSETAFSSSAQAAAIQTGLGNTNADFLSFPPPGLLVPVDEEHPSHLILGVLLTLRYLMPLLQQQVNNTSLKGSFGVMRKEADIQPTPEQLLQVERKG